MRVRRPRPGPLLRRRDGASRQDHRRAGGPRRARQDRCRGRVLRRASRRPGRPGRPGRAAGRVGEVPGRPAGERPGRPESGRPEPGCPGPDSTAEPAGPAHARRFRRVARPRRGQQVRRRGGGRAPAGPRPGLPAARDPPAARGPVRGPGVRPAGTARRAGGVRGQGAGRAATRRPGRPRSDLHPGAGHRHLGGRTGEQQAVAAQRVAVRGRGRRPGPLAARRRPSGPVGRWCGAGLAGRRRTVPARRHRRAAAGAGPGRPRHRAAARLVGGDAGQRPGGPGRHAGAGHARARGRAASRPRRRQERTRSGDTHPVRGKNRAPPARGPALARPGPGYGARSGLSRRPRGGSDRRCRAGRHRQRPLRGLGRARPAGGAR